MAVGLTELVLHRRGRVVVTRFAVAIGVYALLFWLDYRVDHRLRQQGEAFDEGWLRDLFESLGSMSLSLTVFYYPVVLGGALLLTLGGYI